jgi:hypothetical protein
MFLNKLLMMAKENRLNIEQNDFIVTEPQLHAVEVAKFLCCQRQPITGEEANQLSTVWGEKVSEGYRASKIAKNIGTSQRELKGWIQYLEIKEFIKIKTKKLIIAIYIVRFFRALKELAYILNLKIKNESFTYSENINLSHAPNKIIIIAPACAGKSTFSKKKEFCGYTLYDALDKIWDRSTEDYENFRLDFLRKHSGKVCAVDPFYKIKLFDDISVITVMPPKKIHIRNYKIRRKISPTFSMKKILKYRKRILKFSTENNLNIFPDFETALVQISEQEKMQS